MPALNEIQIEILKLFESHNSNEELLEIKKLLTDYLSKRAVTEADLAFDKKNFSIDDLKSWKNEHLRNTK
ncbi:MAG: hypothetical protein ABI723_26835 [Bacteroidia bacterium]